MFKYILTASLFLSPLAIAHKGGHDVPGAIPPQEGGVVRSLETIHLEMISQRDLVKIFVFKKDRKPGIAANFPVSAVAIRPRKKPEKLKLIQKKNHWEFQYNAKGSHRYTLVLSIEQGGHKDKVKWNIEPKR